MAEEKIQFSINAKNNTKSTFNEITSGLKNFQKSSKDTFDAIRNVADKAATAIGGKLGGAITNVTGLMAKMGKGGPWGISAAIAVAAIGTIKKAYDDHKKAVEDHLELMRKMSEAQQNLIKIQLDAKDAYEHSLFEKMAEKAMEAVKQVENLQAAMKNLAASENLSMGAEFNLHIAKINDQFSAALNEACEELKPVVEAEKNLAVALKKQEDARTQSQIAIDREKQALMEVEKKISLQNQVIDAENKAEQDTTKARQKLNELQMERSGVINRLKAAETKAEISELEHKNAVEAATSVLNKANDTWEKLCDANERAIDAQNSISEIDEKLKALKDQEYNTKKQAKDALKKNADEIKVTVQAINQAKDTERNVDKGVQAYNDQHNLSPKKFKYGLDGKLENASDVGKAVGAYDRRTASEQRKIDKQLADMKKKADEARKIPEDKRNAWQKKDIKDYEDADEYYNGEKRGKAKLQALEQQREQLNNQLYTDVSNIATKIDELTNIKNALEQQGLK